MRLNVVIPNNHQVAALFQPWQNEVGGKQIAEVARLADELGFGRLTVGEHFLVPESHRAASGAHFLSASTALAFLAGCTRRIRLASNISIVPLQNPVITAKQWAVLDWLSDGRADLIAGVGWLKEEYDILGVDFSSRGRRLDDYVAAIRALWRDDIATHQGEFVRFRDIAAEPKPVQPGGVPLWFAGDVPATLARVARWGAGWSPYLIAPERIPTALDQIRNHPDYSGQPVGVFYNLANVRLAEGHRPKTDDHDFDTWNAQELVDQIAWVAELGVTEVAPPLPKLDSYQQFLERLHWLAEEVMPKLG